MMASDFLDRRLTVCSLSVKYFISVDLPAPGFLEIQNMGSSLRSQFPKSSLEFWVSQIHRKLSG